MKKEAVQWFAFLSIEIILVISYSLFAEDCKVPSKCQPSQVQANLMIFAFVIALVFFFWKFIKRKKDRVKKMKNYMGNKK